MEDFEAMPRERQLFYIASENYEFEAPCRNDAIPRKG